jgi:hypothetical protein
MVVKPERQFAFETDWIHAYASNWLPTEAPFRHTPAMFRREKISILDIRNVFRNGVVTYDEKLDGPGALWIIEGDDGDGNLILAEIVVISEELDVTVRRVERV